jgi:signal transduction histidine kinase
MRHSKARTIKLLLSARDGRGVLEVRDDGVGFDTASVSDGFGLHNLSTRAETSGGDLTISSTPSGTTVSLTFPI